MPETMSKTPSIESLAADCKAASRELSTLSTETKNRTLRRMADALEANEEAILAANDKDVSAAREDGLADALIDRLVLNPDRITKMADALRDVASFADPVGEMSGTTQRPSGIEVGKMRIPLGVIGMIYEARPNVTADAAGLCFKAGNAVLLRGGSNAFHSNQAVAAALHEALEAEDVPPAAVTLVPTTDRAAVREMLTLNQHLDLVIPRGGEGLIRFVDETSQIPVIKHYKGVCHLYVDQDADLETAEDLLLDGKVSRPSVCNALETLLVHEDVAKDFLPRAKELLDRKDVELRGDARTQQLLPGVGEATDEDYAAEYLDLTLAARVVGSPDAAMEHITEYGSNHTEVIASDDLPTARRFVRAVDASVVLVNASSRFSDGGELGLGAEIGISTTKLHAYGPMGLEALTTEKFVVYGDGET
ncbi:MAG: glutamate-5-semialdehyde dehydrogenase, partial [Salinibacter sp.]|uniref:glutamate-5-semialdehyde dehydrogenase n=1 Tax=Salinibacter sp. TaxID=2065818 RepID=UPI002FC2E82E